MQYPPHGLVKATYVTNALDNAQVIWVDLLTEREFNAGFGSHTPMFTGQVRPTNKA